ncbi:transmembrane protein 52B-like isoform X1 [Anguilla anguilla]|uniref:transmembrane protein 52B-like isoform X1 n=1 Tax=Anguilla anguilla TaxID=7936 RepID=UPI0015AF4318|nr:transmembrane protein 52B-like isoform X1 [Anguilla anguilla]
MRSIEVLLTFLVLLVSFIAADERCIKNCQRDFDPSNLWYVWVILVFISALLGCGFIASCIKMCCRSNKPPVPVFESHPLEVTVISIDHHQNTMRNISPAPSFTQSHAPRPFTTAADSFSPPPYNLCTLDSLPQYDEALAMPANAPARVGIGNAEDLPGDFYEARSPDGEGEPTEFTWEAPRREGLRDTPDYTAWDEEEEEEEPPAYELYGGVAEDEFNEVDLDELDPAERHGEDVDTREQNV